MEQGLISLLKRSINNLMKRIHLKKIITVWMMLTLLVQLTSCAVHKNRLTKKHVTILGLGDSITEGGPDFFSYLFPLDSMLRNTGYEHSFIGPRRSVQISDTLHHSGFSGKTAEFLAAHADSIYSLYPADIVLLHSGHNHFVEESPVKSIINAHRTIIETIQRRNPSAIIFVAAVITAGKLPKYEYIPQLNKSIKALVDSLHDQRVLFVDQSGGWDWNINTISDKVHPNREGARKIATHWFDAITNMSKKN